MIGLCAATVELKNRKIFALLEFFDRIAFNIVTAVVKFVCVVTQFIKNFQQPLIYFLAEVNKSCAAVMIAGIG